MNESVAARARLPELAIQVLDRWQALRVAGAVPALGDIAPTGIPAALIPWTMTLRRTSQGKLVYGVVGEGVGETHAENPRGKPFLYDASPAVVTKWSAFVNRSLDQGIAFWAVSRGVRTRDWVHFGRLGLPLRAQDDAALLLLFFKLGKAEAPDDDVERITWLAPDAP